MSSPGTQTTAGPSWDAIAQGVGLILAAAQPVVAGAEIVFPGGAVAIEIANKLLQGLVAEEPTAKALIDQFISGAPPTADQLAADIAARKGAFANLDAAVAARIAQLQAVGNG